MQGTYCNQFGHAEQGESSGESDSEELTVGNETVTDLMELLSDDIESLQASYSYSIMSTM